MKKKITCMLLAASMALTYTGFAYAEEFIQAAPSAGEEQAVQLTEISASDLEAKAGEIITVPVMVANNKGFTDIQLTMQYDANILEPVSGSLANGDILQAVSESSGVVLTAQSIELLGSAAQTVTENGKLFSYQFKVKDSVTGFTRSTIHIIVNRLENRTADAVAQNVQNNAKGSNLLINKDVVTPVRITMPNQTFTYDNTPHKVIASVDPAVEYKTTYNGKEELPVEAGEYTVEAVVTEEGYTGSAAAKLTIEPASIAVKANDISKGVGSKDPDLTYQITGGSFFNEADDGITGELAREAGEGKGTYQIRQGTLSAGDNYKIDFTPGTLTIEEKKEQSVTVADFPAKTYGDDGFQLDVTYDTESGLTSAAFVSTNPSVATVDAAGNVVITGAGTTDIITTVAGDSSYADAVIKKTLTVQKKALKAVVNTAPIPYGEANANTIVAYTGDNGIGFVNGDTAASFQSPLQISGIEEYNAGTYNVTLSGIESNNYDVTYQNGTVTITQRDITLTHLNVFDKTPDETAAAQVNFSTAVLDGAIAGDDVKLNESGIIATFAQMTVGENIAVAITGLSLAGKDAGNYNLKNPTFETTANIRESITAADVARQITTVPALQKNMTKITMPTVPSGFSVALKSSDREDVIALDGTIKAVQQDTPVALVFTVTNNANAADTGDTQTMQVTVYKSDTVTITVESENEGYGTVEGGGIYMVNEEVTVIATPKGSYRFREWEADGESESLDAEYTFTATKDMVLTAKFRSVSGGSLNYNTTSKVQANISSGTIIAGTEIKLSTSTSGATIYYTTNNKTPTSSSTKYTGPIEVTEDMTIKAIAVKSGKTSPIASFYYTVRAAKAQEKTNASSIKYMKAYSEDRFMPDKAATRFDVLEALDMLYDVEEGTTEKEFSDLSGTDAELVNKFASVGIISGYANGTFGGDRNITRAEFMTILMKLLDYEEDEKARSGFTDIDNHWAKTIINSFAKAGYVSGYPDGTFRPDDKVTRAEVVSVLNRIVGTKSAAASQRYSDLPASHWAFGQIMAVVYY